MSITADDLKSPKGEFTIEMFPEEEENITTFNVRLEGYADDGEVKATAVGLTDGTLAFDRATKAWATIRGLNDVLNRMLTTPMAVDVRDKGQANFVPTQLTILERKIAAYMAEFQAEVDLLSEEVVQRFSPSGHVTHKIKLF